MARTIAPDYADRRQHILDHAAVLFASEGFHKASMSGIARACDTSKSSLYHYFPSKEDILYAVMHGHTELLLQIADDAIAEGGGPQQQLLAVTKGFMEVYATAQSKHIVLLNELGSLPARERDAVVTLQNNIIDRIQTILEKIEPGLKKRSKLRRPVAMIFMGMINWTYTWFEADGPVTPDAFANLVVKILLNGLPGVASSTGRQR